MTGLLAPMATWSRRRWAAAGLGGLVVAVLVALPTAVIPNPVFGRSIEVTWWSYPVVLLTGILGGLLIATYVREPVADHATERHPEGTGTTLSGAVGEEMARDPAGRLGIAGALVSFFAVGCPVCNKLVLLALGASGAVSWFAPLQPVLALASLVMMAVALRLRLRGEQSCRVPG
jgi:hypothetical protein